MEFRKIDERLYEFKTDGYTFLVDFCRESADIICERYGFAKDFDKAMRKVINFCRDFGARRVYYEIVRRPMRSPQTETFGDMLCRVYDERRIMGRFRFEWRRAVGPVRDLYEKVL